jgi:hypothetical protein
VPRSDPQNCPLTAMVSEERGVPKGLYTAKKQYQKFETNIPRKGIARTQSDFRIHVSVNDLYIPTIDLPILLQEICGLIMGIKTSLTDTQMWKLVLRAVQKRDT